MRFTRSVQFEPTEVEVFERALPAGYDSALGLGDNDKPRVRSLRTRLTQTIRPGEPEHEDRLTEPFFLDDLQKIWDTLDELIAYLEPQTKLSWWEEQYQAKGFAYEPGLQGLADERRVAIKMIADAMSIIWDAIVALR